MTPSLPPTPVLAVLRAAAEQCGPAGQRLVEVIAAGYPHSLERRPAQLLRAADAAAEDLDRLLAMAGFTDTDALRRRAAGETARRLAAPDLRITTHEDGRGEHGDRAALRRIISSQQENLMSTLHALQANGSLELAAAAVLAGRRRWVLGDLRSLGFASLLVSDLTAALRDVTLVQPGAGATVNALCDAHGNDVLIAYSFREYSRFTLDAAREFRRLGAAVVALTDSRTGPICRYATHVVVVDTGGEPAHQAPAAVAATGHVLAALAAAGAKGAGRRARLRAELTATLNCYVEPAARPPSP